MGGGGEETWIEASVHEGKEAADEEAKDEATIKLDGETEKGRVGSQSNQK